MSVIIVQTAFLIVGTLLLFSGWPRTGNYFLGMCSGFGVLQFLLTHGGKL